MTDQSNPETGPYAPGTGPDQTPQPPEQPPTTQGPLLPPEPAPVVPVTPPSNPLAPLGPSAPPPEPTGGGSTNVVVNVAPPDFTPVIDAINEATKTLSDVIGGVANDVIGGLTPILQQIIDAVNGVAQPIIDAINAGSVAVVTAVQSVGADINKQAQQDTQQIVDTVNGAVTQLINDADTNAANIIAAVNDQGQQITLAIGASTQQITETINSTAHDLETTITDDLQATDNVIINVGNEITSGIESTLNTLLPPLLDTLTINTQVLSGLASGLLSNLTPVTELWQTLMDTIGKNKAANLKGIPDYSQAWTTGSLTAIEADTGIAAGAGILGKILQFPGVAAAGGELTGLAGLAAGLGGLGAGIVGLLVLADVLQEIKSAFAKAPLELVDQVSQGIFKPAIPDVGLMIQAQRRGIAIDGDLATQAHKQGWPDWAINLLQQVSLTRLTPTDYVDLWRRKYLTDNELGVKLGAIGLDPDATADVQNLSAFVPQPQDVIRFLLRDVYFPDIVSAFQADANFAEAWAAGHVDFERVGVDYATALKFWEAHWELPSATEGYSLYHRISPDGTGDPVTLPDGSVQNRQIKQTDLDRLLRARGVEPFWRQPLINVAFRPLTRIDLRRAYTAGVLSETDVFAGYINLGYTSDNATKLTALTVALAQQAQSKALDPLATSTRDKVVTAYEKGLYSSDELSNYLTTRGYSPAETAAIVADSATVRALDQRTASVAGIKRLFDAGDWDETTTRGALAAVGLGTVETDNIITLWTLELTHHNLHVKHAAHVDATKAEATKAYEEGLINAAQATADYTALGLSQNEATLLLQLADKRRSLQTIREQTDAIKSEYLAGHIDQPTASQRLDALNLPAISRDSLLIKWQNELRKLAQHLPLATIGELRKADLLTDADATDLLKAQGLAANVITNLLALWGSQEAASKIKAAQAVSREQAAAAARAAAAKARADRAAARLHRQLSPAQVAAAARDGLITAQDAQARLVQLGYTTADAFDFLATHKVDVSGLLP